MAPDRPHQTAQGIALILGSVLLMSFVDALVKYLSGTMTTWQIYFWRALLALPAFAVLAWWSRTSPFERVTGWVALRSLLLVLTWVFYYAALPLLPLSLVAAIIYINPIITMLLAALMLAEPVRRMQWISMVVGFTGVLIALRPGSDAFTIAAILPLAAAVFYSCAMVLTRSKCQTVPALSLAMNLQGLFLLTGLGVPLVLAALPLPEDLRSAHAFLLGPSGEIGGLDWAILATMAVMSIGYFTGVARAYQIASPTVIASFDYSYLIFAALWGVILFQETPDTTTLIGMGLIAGAGLLALKGR